MKIPSISTIRNSMSRNFYKYGAISAILLSTSQLTQCVDERDMVPNIPQKKPPINVIIDDTPKDTCKFDLYV